MLGPSPTENREIADDEVLTQHGRQDEPFRKALRELRHPPRLERDMSLILGEADVVEATLLRFGLGKHDYAKYAVRYTTAGALRSRGFAVVHTGRYPGNPYHVSVSTSGAWGPRQAADFDECFEGGARSGRPHQP